MANISAEVVIDAPAEEVWEALVDAGSLSRWLPDNIDLESLPRLGGGSSSPMHYQYDLFSTVREEAAELEAGRSYAYEVSNVGPIKSAYNCFSLTDSEGATVLSQSLSFQMKYGPVGAITGDLVFRPQFRRQMRTSLAALKEFIEAREPVAALPEAELSLVA